MVYLAELSVVMTDRLKIIVRMRTRNAPRVHGHKRIDVDGERNLLLTSCYVTSGKGLTPVVNI